LEAGRLEAAEAPLTKHDMQHGFNDGMDGHGYAAHDDLVDPNEAITGTFPIEWQRLTIVSESKTSRLLGGIDTAQTDTRKGNRTRVDGASSGFREPQIANHQSFVRAYPRTRRRPNVAL
jgi:hypothetical protein